MTNNSTVVSQFCWGLWMGASPPPYSASFLSFLSQLPQITELCPFFLHFTSIILLAVIISAVADKQDS